MSTPRSDCSLLVFILNDPDLLDDVLAAMLEAGAHGATVLEGRGMWQVLSSEMPIFTGLSSLFPSTGGTKRTILCVIPSLRIREMTEIIQDVTGDLSAPGSGILFALPLSHVWGLAEELELDDDI